MQARARQLNPRLAFLPLMYFDEIRPKFVEDYREVIDGVVVAYLQDREEIERTWAVLNDADITAPGELSYPWNTPSHEGDFVMASQPAQVLPTSPCRLLFRERDDFTGPTAGYHFKQVLVDGEVVWEEDVAGGSARERLVAVDITDRVRNTTNVTVAFRLIDKKGVSNFGVRWRLSDLRGEGLQPAADFTRPQEWTVTRQGAFETGFGRQTTTGQRRFHVPFISMTAGEAGEFRQRHGDPATPRTNRRATAPLAGSLAGGQVRWRGHLLPGQGVGQPDLPAHPNTDRAIPDWGRKTRLRGAGHGYRTTAAFLMESVFNCWSGPPRRRSHRRLRWGFARSITVGLAATALASGAPIMPGGATERDEEIVFAVRQPGKDPHYYANFGYFAFDPERKAYGQGGKLCRLHLGTGRLTVLLDDPSGGVRDPQVSYDGTKILFAYRKGGTPNYLLYEIQADGSGLRQLTDGPWDDIEPTYLPDGGILFCSSRCRRWVNCWPTPVAVLHRCDADGRNIRAVSSNNQHDNTPWVLPDGRVLYTRWEYVDRSEVSFHHLWTANPDGTGQTVFFGNMHPGIAMLDAKPIPGTRQGGRFLLPGARASRTQRPRHDCRSGRGAGRHVVRPTGEPDRQTSATLIRSPRTASSWRGKRAFC